MKNLEINQMDYLKRPSELDYRNAVLVYAVAPQLTCIRFYAKQVIRHYKERDREFIAVLNAVNKYRYKMLPLKGSNNCVNEKENT